jgi:hypothetical protein
MDIELLKKTSKIIISWLNEQKYSPKHNVKLLKINLY